MPAQVDVLAFLPALPLGDVAALPAGDGFTFPRRDGGADTLGDVTTALLLRDLAAIPVRDVDAHFLGDVDTLLPRDIVATQLGNPVTGLGFFRLF